MERRSNFGTIWVACSVAMMFTAILAAFFPFLVPNIRILRSLFSLQQVLSNLSLIHISKLAYNVSHCPGMISIYSHDQKDP